MVQDPIDVHLFAQPFAQPSFLTGIARIFDWRVTLDEYNTSPTPEAADYYALLSDWKAIGGDLWNAINEFGGTSRYKSNERQHIGKQQRT